MRTVGWLAYGMAAPRLPFPPRPARLCPARPGRPPLGRPLQAANTSRRPGPGPAPPVEAGGDAARCGCARLYC